MGIFESILVNLQNVYTGLFLFTLAYASNILISLFYNIKITDMKFNLSKLMNGLLKFAVFCVGISLLCVVVTSLPVFATNVGFAIPDEYVAVFSNLVIISAFLIACCRYVAESTKKLNAILNNSEID